MKLALLVIVAALSVLLTYSSRASIIVTRRSATPSLHPPFHHLHDAHARPSHGHRSNHAAGTHIKLDSVAGMSSHFVHPHAKPTKDRSHHHQPILQGVLRAAASHAHHPAAYSKQTGHSKLIVPPRVKMSSSVVHSSSHHLRRSQFTAQHHHQHNGHGPSHL